MLMPGSSEAAVQSPGPVLQTSSTRQTSLCSRQVQCCRSRADELEMREKEHMKAQTCLGAREREKRRHEGSTAFSRWCTAAAHAKETQGRRSQEASHEVATEFRDAGTPAQPCRRHSSATAPQHNSATVQGTQQNKKNDRSRSHQSSRTSRRLRRQ